MVRTVEPLELPSATYQALEQIARFQGITPAGVVEKLVQQFQLRENLPALRLEYQRLADRELNRTITAEEEAHLEQISRLNPGLNAIVTVAPDVLERARAAEGFAGRLSRGGFR